MITAAVARMVESGNDRVCVKGHAPPPALSHQQRPIAPTSGDHFTSVFLGPTRILPRRVTSGSFRTWLLIIPGCNCHGCRLRAPAVDIERRAAQKVFDVREFEACHLEAAEETSARQDPPRLRSRALSTCQTFLEKLKSPHPFGRARSRGRFKPVSVRRAFGPVAAQALGRRRDGGEEETAGKGVWDAEEVGAQRTPRRRKGLASH